MIDARDVLADFGPTHPAVLADVDVAVIGAGPQDSRDHGRLGDFGHRAVLVRDVAVVSRQDTGLARRPTPAAAGQSIGDPKNLALIEVDLFAHLR
jgi:hypothetical protein